MCYSLPGPRCSRHALQRLAKAEANLNNAREAKETAEAAFDIASHDLNIAKIQQELETAEKNIAAAEARLKGAQGNYKRSVTERDKSMKDYRARAEELKKAQEDYDLSPAGIEEMRTGVVTRLDDKGKAVPTGEKRPVDIKKAVESEIVRKEKIEASKKSTAVKTAEEEGKRIREEAARQAAYYDEEAKDNDYHSDVRRDMRDWAKALPAIAERRAAKILERATRAPDPNEDTWGSLNAKQIEDLESEGGRTWAKGDHKRVYFEMPRLFGLVGGNATYYKSSGRPAHIDIPGLTDRISNGRAVEFRKPFFDATKNKWSGTGDEEIDNILIPSLIEEFGVGKKD